MAADGRDRATPIHPGRRTDRARRPRCPRDPASQRDARQCRGVSRSLVHYQSEDLRQRAADRGRRFLAPELGGCVKDWEQAGILTDVLDRHRERLLAAQPSDWTLYWSLEPFLQLLASEPVLAALVGDYMEDAARRNDTFDRRFTALAERISNHLENHREALVTLKAF